MAYKNLVITPPKYASQDTVKESQFYRGFSTVSNSKSVNLYDSELIKQDLFNQFQTKKGERVMNPEFGTIIWSLIYDPLTSDLKESIKDDVNRILSNDPRITPLSVIIVEKDYGILIEATLAYTKTNQTENMRIAFDKEVGLLVGQ